MNYTYGFTVTARANRTDEVIPRGIVSEIKKSPVKLQRMTVPLQFSALMENRKKRILV